MDTRPPNSFGKEISDFCVAIDSGIEDSLGVVLYGSHANGTATDESDTDVLVVLKKRTGESVEKLRHIAERTMQGRYAVQIMGEAEMRELLGIGDTFFKHDVFGQGVIMLDRDGRVSEMKDAAFSNPADLDGAKNVYLARFLEEKERLRELMANLLERVHWGFNHLMGIEFARRGMEPKGLSDLYRLAGEDEKLSKYIADFIRARKLFKVFESGGEFSFKEFEQLYRKLEALEREVMDVEKDTRFHFSTKWGEEAYENYWVGFEDDPYFTRTRKKTETCRRCAISLLSQLESDAEDFKLGYALDCWKAVCVLADSIDIRPLIEDKETKFLPEFVNIYGKYGGYGSSDTKVIILYADSGEEAERYREALTEWSERRNLDANSYVSRGCKLYQDRLFGDWEQWGEMMPIVSPEAREEVAGMLRINFGL